MEQGSQGGGGPRVGGRYELGELLGRGGMAEVRRGTDVRLGRTVAVKRLRSDLAADPVFQARFRREAQSAAGLNHPNIVSVYDTGEEMAPDGTHVQPYIVMEYVAGRTLREVLNDGRKVLPERALEIVGEILEALDYSHRSGIIHRDIKPANVMLTPSGGVKVMDFGIARALSDGTSTVTQTQAVVGTAQYLSPEQARGETVDARSDVYSTGCLLYELLAGRPPFVGDSPFSVAYQHVREQPLPPSAYNPEVTPQVDSIVMKALAKRVEDRYQSAADMGADLHRYLDGRPVEARTQTAAAPAEATSLFTPLPIDPDGTGGAAEEEYAEEQRSRWPVILLVLLGLLLVAGAVVGAVQLFGEDEPEQVTVPDVTGLTLRAARSQLEDRGLEATVTRRNSADVPKGQVMQQNPDAEETVDKGSEVALVVSAGEETAIVPFLLGSSLSEARAELQERDLTWTTETRDSDEPKNTVIETDPVASEEVPVGTSVHLVLSSGPVKVPGVVGLSENEAVRRLENANLRVEVEYDQNTPAERGLVLNQSPEEGDRVAPRSIVTLVVSRYVEPTPTETPTPTESATPTPSETPSETPSDVESTPTEQESEE